MATRHEVRWTEGGIWKKRGFAFMEGALEMYNNLCGAEAAGQNDIHGVVVEYLGPNGERASYPIEESEPAAGESFCSKVLAWVPGMGR